jgi:hypothetical protein
MVIMFSWNRKNVDLKAHILHLENENQSLKDVPYISNNKTYMFLTRKELLDKKLLKLSWQRPISEERIDIMKKDFELYQPIILGNYNDKLYILDGQHRHCVLKEQDFSDKIPVLQIDCTSTEQLKYHFRKINNLLSLSDIYIEDNVDLRKFIVEETLKYLINKYDGPKSKYKTFTHKKATRPRTNLIELSNKLNDLLKETPELFEGNPVDNLITFIEERNEYYQKYRDKIPKLSVSQEKNRHKYINDTIEKHKYILGLFKNFEWISTDLMA